MNLPKNVYYQSIIIGIAAAFALAYEFRADEFSAALWLEELIVSFLVVFFLSIITYFLQRKLIPLRGGKLTYKVFGWGIVVSVFASLISSGRFPLFLTNAPEMETGVARVGHKKPWFGRADAAAIAGIAPTLGLITGLLFLQNNLIADAAMLFAAWSLLPIPFSNGFAYFNKSPLDGAITALLGIVLYITYFLTHANVVPLLVLVIFIPYQWVYIYVSAKRHSY